MLDSILQGEVTKVKKYLSSEIVNFKHPFTGDTPLHFAAICSHSKRKQICELLIRKNANLNEKNKDFLTPLHLASDKFHYEVMEILLKHGAKVNVLDGLGQSALHRCAREGNVQACQVLLSYGADTSIVSLQGYTADQMAKENVQKLLANHRLTSTGDLEYKLLEASKSGEIEIVRTILNSHPHLVNCRDVDGRQSTPLHFAAGYNRLDVVDFLLSRGADPHAKDKGGLGLFAFKFLFSTTSLILILKFVESVPLHNACSYGHYEVSELLVKKGSNVNATDLWKFTALHEAAAKGKYDIVKLLLRHGASVDKKNRDGNTCRDLCREGDQDIIDLLTGDAALLDASKKGHLNRVMKILTPENVNCRDSQGRNSTPLHLASGYNNLEVAEYLLENGADCNASDKGGLIPLHNAASYGYVFSSYTTLYLIFSLKHFYSKKSFRYSSASH